LVGKCQVNASSKLLAAGKLPRAIIKLKPAPTIMVEIQRNEVIDVVFGDAEMRCEADDVPPHAKIVFLVCKSTLKVLDTLSHTSIDKA
jgi:hypothetical protein